MWINVHATFRFTNAEWATGNFLGQISVGGLKVSFVLLILTLVPLFLIVIKS